MRERWRKREGEREGGRRERESAVGYLRLANRTGSLRTNHTFTVTPQKAETQCTKHSKKTAHSSSVLDTKNQ